MPISFEATNATSSDSLRFGSLGFLFNSLSITMVASEALTPPIGDFLLCVPLGSTITVVFLVLFRSSCSNSSSCCSFFSPATESIFRKKPLGGDGGFQFSGAHRYIHLYILTFPSLSHPLLYTMT